MDIWIVDIKSKVSPESAMPQDGSGFYCARCAVPARSEEGAIAQLTDHLSEDHVKITELINIRLADAEVWRDDDDEAIEDIHNTKGYVVLLFTRASYQAPTAHAF